MRRQKTPWLLLENVPFMLQLEKGAAMNVITDTLEGLGYRWAYRVIDSRAFGLRPTFTHLLEPGQGYTGGEAFFDEQHVEAGAPPIVSIDEEEAGGQPAGLS